VQYGYCASRSRWFWGCGCTWSARCAACRFGYALAGAKAGGREVLLDTLAGLTLLRARPQGGEPEPAGRQFFSPLRQVIEPVNDTLKGSA
jgi:hypothetical protein